MEGVEVVCGRQSVFVYVIKRGKKKKNVKTKIKARVQTKAITVLLGSNFTKKKKPAV